MPLFSCLHLHIYISTTHSPAKLSPVDLPAFEWSSADGWTADGCEKLLQECSYMVMCVCVCVWGSAALRPFPIQPTPPFTRISCIFTVHPDIMESVCLWNLLIKMYTHNFHCKKVSNLRALHKPHGDKVHHFVTQGYDACVDVTDAFMYYSIAQFTEFKTQSLRCMSSIRWLYYIIL